MTKTILAIIAGLITCIIGVWRMLRRKAKFKREIMDEAKKDLKNAHKNKDSSDILDAWDKSNRV